MPVSIIWSLTNGGAAISEPLDHGADSSGSILTSQEIFMRHDGTNQITAVGFGLGVLIGTYGGDATKEADLAEMFSWGNGATAAVFGGVQLNMDAIGAYAGNWPTFDDKFGSTYNVFRAGTGDAIETRILLPVNMGLTGVAGTIQAGASPNVRFKARIEIPADEGTTGVRQFAQGIVYTYTS